MDRRLVQWLLGCTVAVALIISGGCGGGGGSGAAPAAPVGAPAPPNPPPPMPAPPPAAVITGVTFDWGSHLRAAPGSDNWPATWSDDDRQYAVWGDGGGFGGSDTSGRSSFGVARIEGDAANYQGANRYGGLNGECASAIDGKGHGAPLSLGGVLYVWITPGSNTSGYDMFTLYRSADKGCTWSKLDVAFARADTGMSFGSFVQLGKDNGLARDAYIYSVAAVVTDTSSLSIVQRPGNVVLLRVPASSIQDRGTYEFYAGQDSTGQATWSSDPTRKSSIYQDAAGVGPFAQMSYVPGLNRFVYTNQHGDGSSNAATQSRLTVAEAADPWGPWSVVYKDVFFPQNEATVFQWSFAPKWFANGGRSFTLIFSGTGGNDSWNTVNGTFTTAQ